MRDSEEHGPCCSSAPWWLPEVGSMCFGSIEFMDGSSLSRNVWSFPLPLGCGRIGTTTSADFCSHESGHPGRPVFQPKLLTHGYAYRSPRIRGVNFRCTSASSTSGSVGNGFVVLGPLASENRLPLRRFCSSPRSFGSGFLPTVCHLAAVALA